MFLGWSIKECRGSAGRLVVHFLVLHLAILFLAVASLILTIKSIKNSVLVLARVRDSSRSPVMSRRYDESPQGGDEDSNDEAWPTTGGRQRQADKNTWYPEILISTVNVVHDST